MASSHGKRLEQIVNRKPSARLRPSAKENIVSVLFIFTFTVVNRYYQVTPNWYKKYFKILFFAFLIA